VGLRPADAVAIGFMRACQTVGTTPTDRNVILTGFDNVPESEWVGLSTVDYQLGTVGRLAYDRLQAALDHPNQFGCSVDYVRTRYVKRVSTSNI
jgi:DNA-binding LacI/PurR family transcriptional regulator